MVQLSEQTKGKIDAAVEKLTRDPSTDLPRAVVMVADGQNIVHEVARGWDQAGPDCTSHKEDTTTASIFALWSCTKVLSIVDLHSAH